MSQDYVDLNAQQVANGLARWDQVAGTLDSRWNGLNRQINDLLIERPWGTDTPGTAFEGQFLEPATGYRTTGNEVVADVVETGGKVRTACEASLGADNLQAAEVGGVTVPDFNTSGGGGGSSSGGGGGASSGGSVAMMSSGAAASSLPAAGQSEDYMVMDEGGTYAEAAPGTEQWVPGPGQGQGQGEDYMVMDEGGTYAEAAPGTEQWVPGPGQGQGEVVPDSARDLPADQSGSPSQLSYAGQPLSTDTVNQFPEHPASLDGAGAPDGAGSRGEAPSTGGDYTIQPAPQGERGDGGPAVDGHESGSDSGSSRPVPDGLAEKIRERIDQLPDGAIKHLPDGAIKHLPDGVFQNLPDGVLQQLPEGVVQQLPEGVFQQLPEGLADRLSDAGSPHIPMGEHTDFIPAGDEVTGRPDAKAPR